MNAATIIKTYDNGAHTLQLDGIQFTMSNTGRISWATPDGWARIATDDKTFPLMPNPHSYPDDEYTYAGPITQ